MKHDRDFFVLKDCIRDVILESASVTMTKTLTRYRHRLREKLVSFSDVPKVCLLGAQKQRMTGLLNGCPVSAIPDTGLDVMLMSTAYAEARRLCIQGAEHNCTYLELAVAPTIRTRGKAHDYAWTFNLQDPSLTVDFHVMNDLPFDIILSNTFLFNNDVFTKYTQIFYEDEYAVDEESYELSLIRELGFLHRLEDRLLSLKNADNAVSSPSPSRTDTVKAIEEQQTQIHRELQAREKAQKPTGSTSSSSRLSTPTA